MERLPGSPPTASVVRMRPISSPTESSRTPASGPVLALLSTRTGSGKSRSRPGSDGMPSPPGRCRRPATGSSASATSPSNDRRRRGAADIGRSGFLPGGDRTCRDAPEADVFSAIGAHLHELAPGSIVVVSAADIQAGTLSPRAFFGIEPFLPEIIEVSGRTSPDHGRDPAASGDLISGEIEEVRRPAGDHPRTDLPGSLPEIRGNCRVRADLLHSVYLERRDLWDRRDPHPAGGRRDQSPPSRSSGTRFDRPPAAPGGGRTACERKTFRTLIEKGSEFILIIDEQLTIRFASPPTSR